MAKAPDPLEVLAFINGYSSIPSEQWRARFPDWCKSMDLARKRFDDECNSYRAKWGPHASGSSDPLIRSQSDAEHRWVYLPLIQAALAAHQPSNPL